MRVAVILTLDSMRVGDKKGFTLIELMVVISIISLLSSVVFSSLSAARAKGRDAKRIGDFRSIRTAMELYRNDNSRYPVSPNNCCTGGPGGSHNLNFQAVMNNLIAGGYLPSIPRDPSPDPNLSYMLYDYGPNNNVGVILVTYLEGMPASASGPYNSCRPFVNNWCSTSPVSSAYCLCFPY
jgi:type IV pilus assembly protein PilA